MSFRIIISLTAHAGCPNNRRCPNNVPHSARERNSVLLKQHVHKGPGGAPKHPPQHKRPLRLLSRRTPVGEYWAWPPNSFPNTISHSKALEPRLGGSTPPTRIPHGSSQREGTCREGKVGGRLSQSAIEAPVTEGISPLLTRYGGEALLPNLLFGKRQAMSHAGKGRI